MQGNYAIEKPVQLGSLHEPHTNCMTKIQDPDRHCLQHDACKVHLQKKTHATTTESGTCYAAESDLTRPVQLVPAIVTALPPTNSARG
jgi:hypothetical protein